MDKNFEAEIHEANIEVHRSESKYYEVLHPEVFSKQEQRRIDTILRKADKFILENKKKALEFGAGTGNLTGKLLHMNYRVTAVDISPEMCSILRHRFSNYVESERLYVVNAPIEEADFPSGEFDLVACYSTLHHLPDYKGAIYRLSSLLRKGGVMYLDHESSPFYWENETHSLAQFLKFAYFHSNPALNALYFQIMGINMPQVNYVLSDYWHKKEHSLDHRQIAKIFEKEKFASYGRVDYHLRGTWIPNPLFYLYKHICHPEMSYWIARK